ncbi:APC family permease [Ktedonosporobacter rubrisoli]|uniref:APC family permease n=1 Tax=Ktedonosporobacter rubrisoli TaxID=2509675 RepID=A0A4P6JMG3_KTERU|nr:APC family permease [Ktedonosporobacter rubrisoli]QBD76240.1 APC family permease [Ktedonosporobacter rubrisoli]
MQHSSPPTSAPPLRSQLYVPRVLAPTLRPLDGIGLFFLVLFFLTNVPNIVPAGVSVFPYWGIGLLGFFVPALVATAQLAILFPYAGGIYAWTAHALGRPWSFIAGFCAWSPSIPLIVSTPALWISVLQGINPHWLTESWQQLLCILGLILLSAVLSLQRVRLILRLMNAAALCMLIGVLLFCAASLFWLFAGHGPAVSFSHPADWVPNINLATGSLASFGVIGLTFMGIDSPARLLGEIHPDYQQEAARRRLIIRHVLIGGLLVFLCYLLTSFAMLVLGGNAAFYQLAAPILLTDQILGKFCGSIVAVGWLAFLLFATVAYQITNARLLFVAGIDERIPLWFGQVHPQRRVPQHALLFQTVLSLLAAGIIYGVLAYVFPHFFALKPADAANASLQVVLASLSVMWIVATMFLFFNLLALCIRRALPSAGPQRLLPAGLLMVLSFSGIVFGLLFIADTILYSWTPTIPAGIWAYLIIGFVLIIIILMLILSFYGRSQADYEGLSRTFEATEQLTGGEKTSS